MLRSCENAVLLAVMIFPALLTAQAPLPSFEHYSVAENWTGTAAPVKIRTRAERRFRTVLNMAAREQPNFAGHYVVTTWGCGSNCVLGAILDLRTGAVLQPPVFGRKEESDEHWMWCPYTFDDAEPEFRRDSRLLVVRCGERWDVLRQTEKRPDAYYYLLEDGRFRLLRHVKGSQPSSAP